MLKVVLFLSIFGALNFYVDVRLVGRWPWHQTSSSWFWLGAALFFLLQITGPVGDRIIPADYRLIPYLGSCLALLEWTSYTALGAFTCLLVYTVWSEIPYLAALWVWPSADIVSFDRRRFLTLGAATLATTAVGIVQATSKPHIKHVEIPLAHLPDAFDGFRIVQISDLHVSSLIGHDHVTEVVEMTNGLKPDLIALTGDFVDGSVEQLSAKIAPIATLSAPHGMFYITGNHEYYWGADAWIEKFKEMGAYVLLNEHKIIQRGTSQLVMAGVTDYSTRDALDNPFNPQKSLEGAPEGLVKILLAHQPVSYEKAADAGFDLQLSGHTHAGQYFPFNLFIGFFQRYYRGLNRHDKMWIYVNCGTGFWGPPLRTGVPSEITVLTLRKAPEPSPA